MAFKTFNRTLYYALETTEGTFNTPNATSGYLEVIEPTFTITNRVFDRNPTRNSITRAVQHVGGTSTTDPSAMVELSFTVEMAGSGTAATAPRWGNLLKACGLLQVDSLKRCVIADATSNASPAQAPIVFFHKENISAGLTGAGYSSGDRVGRVIGDTFYDDDNIFFTKASASNTVTSSEYIAGENSEAEAQAAAETASGVAWIPTSGAELGSGNNSSISFRLAFETSNASSSNAYIDIAGARGNVEFAFVSGDRVLMNFTFMGRLVEYGNNATLTPKAEGREIPPAFMGVNLALEDSAYGDSTAAAYTSSVFSQMTINLNNDLVVRDGASFDGGYDVCYITGRNPQLTIDPDSIEDSDYNFWDRFFSGKTMHGQMTIGSTSGNKFLVKFPAAQIANLGDGNRDEVMTYDIAATLTGGDYGSSIKRAYDSSISTDSTAQMNPRNGTNNEFVLIHF